MKITLTNLDRLALLDLVTLPNNFYNITERISEIRRTLFSLPFDVENGEYEFDVKDFWFIYNQLNRLDKDYKLQEKYVPLYRNFVLNNKKEIPNENQ